MPLQNIAVKYLSFKGETLADYDGVCGELVDGLLHWLSEDKVDILYIERARDDGSGWESGNLLRPNGYLWRYHMVAVVGGLVHDAWFPELILPPKEYALNAFPGQKCNLSIDDEDI